MILRRALYREALRTTAAILVVLLVVFAFFGLTGLLARAARGEFADQIVLSLLGLQVAKKFDLLLPLSFYLGVLLTLSRWYRDSEMTVLAACGIGVLEILRPLLTLAVLVAVAVGTCSFYLTPLAGRAIEVVKAESAHRPEPGRLTPGVFTESATGQRIIYAENVQAASGRLENVFAADLKSGQQGVIVARTGSTVTEPVSGNKLLVLRHGRLYDGAPGEAGFRVLDFETYSVRLERKAAPLPAAQLDDQASFVLWRGHDRYASAELHWRLAKPMLVLVLTAFALVLAYTDARRGRLANLFTAILVYFIYSNLLGFAQALIKKGAVPPAVGLWWVHALFALAAAWMIARRAANKPLWAWRSV